MYPNLDSRVQSRFCLFDCIHSLLPLCEDNEGMLGYSLLCETVLYPAFVLFSKCCLLLVLLLCDLWYLLVNLFRVAFWTSILPEGEESLKKELLKSVLRIYQLSQLNLSILFFLIMNCRYNIPFKVDILCLDTNVQY